MKIQDLSCFSGYRIYPILSGSRIYLVYPDPGFIRFYPDYPLQDLPVLLGSFNGKIWKNAFLLNDPDKTGKYGISENKFQNHFSNINGFSAFPRIFDDIFV